MWLVVKFDNFDHGGDVDDEVGIVAEYYRTLSLEPIPFLDSSTRCRMIMMMIKLKLG